ncbi:hypothetical protein BGZ65_002646 [Modicella reniformis]|uniref:Uncharacterized protein n=1 Tax=Modicella reniformis TaxID=1440133 RepID=A0A9P6M9K8_9FUNG|nr:hypothetical protein BGZ65_002646 [Modicella reniformis]
MLSPRRYQNVHLKPAYYQDDSKFKPRRTNLIKPEAIKKPKKKKEKKARTARSTAPRNVHAATARDRALRRQHQTVDLTVGSIKDRQDLFSFPEHKDPPPKLDLPTEPYRFHHHISKHDYFERVTNLRSLDQNVEYRRISTYNSIAMILGAVEVALRTHYRIAENSEKIGEGEGSARYFFRRNAVVKNYKDFPTAGFAPSSICFSERALLDLLCSDGTWVRIKFGFRANLWTPASTEAPVALQPSFFTDGLTVTLLAYDTSKVCGGGGDGGDGDDVELFNLLNQTDEAEEVDEPYVAANGTLGPSFGCKVLLENLEEVYKGPAQCLPF